jgi:hypothetical protein
MLDKLLKFLTSLKLTVICLAYAMVLVFLGTIAQGSEGLYQVQARFFKSILIFKPFQFLYATQGYESLSEGARHLVDPILAVLNFLILPGGYIVGGILLVNLALSYITRSQFTFRNLGLLMVHAGLVLLLLGQVSTDVTSRESSMRLVEGQSKDYSESFSDNELALIDTSDPNVDQVTAVPESRLAGSKDLSLPGSAFVLRVKQYWPNADLLEKPAPQSVPSGATQGEGRQLQVLPKPKPAKTDERGMPSAVVEIASPKGSLGSYLISPLLRPQSFSFEGKNYQVLLRFTRHYYPFNISLLKFRHDVYTGTDIPKNFSSEINLLNPNTSEQRRVLIRMNEPLRYQGITFYQGSYDPNDPRVSILQVVRNPGWLTPYISCVLVGLGLTWQFLMHLIGFVHERKTIPSQPAVIKTV